MGVLVLRFLVTPKKSGHPGSEKHICGEYKSDRVPILIGLQLLNMNGLLSSGIALIDIQDLSEMFNERTLIIQH